MNRNIYSWSAAALLLGTALTTVATESITYSGYVSAFAGKTLKDGEIFLSDYPNVAIYDNEWSFDQDTTVGLQVVGKINDDFSVTAQLVSRGADNYQTNAEWLYFTYRMNDKWSLQGGRKRLPMFYYSDFFDVGYAYLWIRPPADTYTWQVFNYNGFNVQYNDTWGNWSVFSNIYMGREDSNNNKLLSEFFFFEETDENWKNMLGFVFSMSKDWVEMRVSHLSTTRDRFRSGVQRRADQDMSFNSLSVNLTPGNFTLLTEYQRSTIDASIDPSNDSPLAKSNFTAYLVTLGYNFHGITPYISYSEFDEEDNKDPVCPGGVCDNEHHLTQSIGLRWDFSASAAFKIQYDKVDDKGIILPPDDGSLVYSEVAGDSTAITFGIDAVF